MYQNNFIIYKIKIYNKKLKYISTLLPYYIIYNYNNNLI